MAESRIENFTDKQLKGMLEVASGTIIDMDEDIGVTSGFELGLSLMDQIDVPLNLVARIETELTRRNKLVVAQKQGKVIKTSGTRAFGMAKNLHAWSENLFKDIENLRRDFIMAPVPGEKR